MFYKKSLLFFTKPLSLREFYFCVANVVTKDKTANLLFKNKTYIFASMNSRERILLRIQKALQTPIDAPVAKPSLTHQPFKPLIDESLEVCFAHAFQQNKGDFYFCQSLEEFLWTLKKWLAYHKIQYLFAEEPYLQTLLQIPLIDYEIDDIHWEKAEVALVLAEFLVAETGSILISSKRASGRKWVTFAPIQIVVAFTSQLIGTLAETMEIYQERNANSFPSMLSFISAPSQTADIDHTLVMGAQGATKLILFLIDESVNETNN